MSGQAPSQAPQPDASDAYTTSSNPTSKTPIEQSASFDATASASAASTPVPQKQSTHAQGLHNAKFEQGAGVHGAPAGEEAKGLTEEDVGRHKELDGEQMAAPGEGRVAAAVRQGGKGMGGGGSEPDLAADLDRKKAEQQEARDQIKQERKEGVRAGGEAGQSGGPAVPVD